jgi:NADPH2:quinone reductase
MSYAIRIHETGGPDVLKYGKIAVPPPGPGEILIRHTAIGLNFIDVYHRSGLYPLPLPFTPGTEGAGVVEALGEGVTTLKKGDRVAYAGRNWLIYRAARHARKPRRENPERNFR